MEDKSQPEVTLTLPQITEDDDPLLGAAIAEGEDIKPHIIPFVRIAGKHLVSIVSYPTKAQYNKYSLMCVEKWTTLADSTPTASSTHV